LRHDRPTALRADLSRSAAVRSGEQGRNEVAPCAGSPRRSTRCTGPARCRPREADQRSEPEREQPRQPHPPAGTTFFGQFVAHDITFDTSSTLGTPTEPTTAPNGRTPSLDLDSVYGGGATATPALYDTGGDPAKLLIGNGGLFEDLPRLA